MPRRVEILKTETPYKHSFLSVQEATFRHELYNGKMSGELVRISLERGDSAAVILHDQKAGSVILTEQFRYPTYSKGPGWMLEIPAGTIEEHEGRDPSVTLRREVMEEIGYDLRTPLQKVLTFYVSPGGTSERIHLYYSAVSPKDKTGKGGGLIHEGEDIRILNVKLMDALRKIYSGDIVDAKSIIGLHWLYLNRSSRKKLASSG